LGSVGVGGGFWGVVERFFAGVLWLRAVVLGVFGGVGGDGGGDPSHPPSHLREKKQRKISRKKRRSSYVFRRIRIWEVRNQKDADRATFSTSERRKKKRRREETSRFVTEKK